MAKTTTPGVEQLVSDYEDLLNGDFSKLDVISESYRYHGPGVPEGGVHGREAYRAFLQSFRDGFSDLEYAIEMMLVSDDLTMLEWRVTGTHDGEFNGIPPTNREIEMETMAKQVIADGEIQEEWGYYDTQAMMAQLGIAE